MWVCELQLTINLAFHCTGLKHSRSVERKCTEVMRQQHLGEKLTIWMSSLFAKFGCFTEYYFFWYCQCILFLWNYKQNFEIRETEGKLMFYLEFASSNITSAVNKWHTNCLWPWTVFFYVYLNIHHITKQFKWSLYICIMRMIFYVVFRYDFKISWWNHAH